MGGGYTSPDNALKDVTDAAAMGIDAFVINLSNDYLVPTENLFAAATQINCAVKLAFSFDITDLFITRPDVMVEMVTKYQSHACYFRYQNRPFVTTFAGALATFSSGGPVSPAQANIAWKTRFLNPLASQSIVPYFLPIFDWSGLPISSTYSTYDIVDGLGTWDSAWTSSGAGRVDVSAEQDNAYMSARGQKSYLMPISTFQYKHNQWGNWIRRGENTLPLRMEQILRVKPEFIEILTWNDAGEGHYMGNLYSTQIDAVMASQTLQYDHRGWQTLLKALIRSYKSNVPLAPSAGLIAEGAMWYRQLFLTDYCNDPQGPPSNLGDSSDLLVVSLLLSKPLAVDIKSGSNNVITYTGTVGLNTWQVPLGRGTQTVTIRNVGGSPVASVSSSAQKGVWNDCSGTGQVYNFNYQVVSITASGASAASVGTVNVEAEEDQSEVASSTTRSGFTGGETAGIVLGSVFFTLFAVFLLVKFPMQRSASPMERV